MGRQPEGAIFFSAVPQSERLWGPPSSQIMNLTININLMSRLRMHGPLLSVSTSFPVLGHRENTFAHNVSVGVSTHK
jgi:hypothetical protein